MTRSEAARRLGCPEGTVAGRLARARLLLAGRLARRGVVASGALAGAMSPGAASALVPLLDSTIAAGSLLAAGLAPVVSSNVAAISEGVVRAMLMTKIKGVLAGLAVLLVLAVGLAFHMTPATGQPAAPPDRPARAEPVPKAAEVGRYQISAYGYTVPGGGAVGQRGAYIIDTATGEVFHVVNDNPPDWLGSVTKGKK